MKELVDLIAFYSKGVAGYDAAMAYADDTFRAQLQRHRKLNIEIINALRKQLVN